MLLGFSSAVSLSIMRYFSLTIRIMCTNDTRDRVSIDSSDRHLDRPAIDIRSTLDLHLGRPSVDMSTDTLSTLDQQQAIVGRVSTDTRVGR